MQIKKAPAICKIKLKVMGVSPSALYAMCCLGVRRKRDKCKNCEHFIPEQIHRGFQKAIEKGGKSIV